MPSLEPLSDQEFERLKAIPFDELTDDEKTQLNFRLMDNLSDEQFSFFFDVAMEKVFGNYQVRRNK